MIGRLTRPYGPGLEDGGRVVAYSTAVFFAGAGILHVSAAADHTELPVMLAGFIAVAALQIGFAAVLLWRRPDPVLLVGAIALTVLAVGVWVISRTSGLPFMEDGHEEPIGFKDAITVLFELASLPGLVLLMSRELGQVRLPSARLGSSTVAGLAAGAFALSVPALVLGGSEHHADGGHGADGHTHGDGEEQAAGKQLASAEKGKHHPGRRAAAVGGATTGDSRSHGHAGGGTSAGAGQGAATPAPAHGGGGSAGGGGTDHSGGGGAGHGDGGKHEGGGGQGGGSGGGSKGGHGQNGHGNAGNGKPKGGHGKGHGQQQPDHGEHEQQPQPGGQPTLTPPEEPLQRICNDAGVCIP